jgi:hypothetical protein
MTVPSNIWSSSLFADRYSVRSSDNAVKVEVVLKHAVKLCRGGGEAKLHLRLTSALDGAEESTPRPGRFTTGKEPRYQMNRILGGTQKCYGRFGEQKNVSTPVEL